MDGSEISLDVEDSDDEDDAGDSDWDMELSDKDSDTSIVIEDPEHLSSSRDGDRIRTDSTTQDGAAPGDPDTRDGERNPEGADGIEENGESLRSLFPFTANASRVRARLPSFPASATTILSSAVSDLGENQTLVGPKKTKVVVNDTAYATYRAVLYYVRVRVHSQTANMLRLYRIRFTPIACALRLFLRLSFPRPPNRQR